MTKQTKDQLLKEIHDLQQLCNQYLDNEIKQEIKLNHLAKENSALNDKINLYISLKNQIKSAINTYMSIKYPEIENNLNFEFNKLKIQEPINDDFYNFLKYLRKIC